MNLIQKITLFCFAASYGVALGLELWHLFRRRPIHHVLANLFGAAGLLAHTLYLAAQRPPLVGQFGLLLVVSWILAVVYLSSSLQQPKQNLSLFALPVILVLVGLATVFGPPTDGEGNQLKQFLQEETKLLGGAHAVLLLLAAVGVCVGFIASIMYLVQAHRLKEKTLPGQGLRLPSLERLETMNRRALGLAFPLLTGGMLLGVVLLIRGVEELHGWTDPRVLASGILWLVFAIVLYLRFGLHLRGRRVALLTILAFGLLLVTLVVPHMPRGGQP